MSIIVHLKKTLHGWRFDNHSQPDYHSTVLLRLAQRAADGYAKRGEPVPPHVRAILNQLSNRMG